VCGGVDSAVERIGWYRAAGDRDCNSDGVSRHPGVTWTRQTVALISPFLLGHRLDATDSVASIDAPHPWLHAVAFYEGWGQLDNEAELGCLSGTSQDVLLEHCSVAEVIFE
jgi:hypothetical protein